MAIAIFASELKPGMRVIKAYGADFQTYLVRQIIRLECEPGETLYQVWFENGSFTTVDDDMGKPFLLTDPNVFRVAPNWPDAAPGSEDGVE